MISIITLELAWYLTQPTLNIWILIVIFAVVIPTAWHYVKKHW